MDRIQEKEKIGFVGTVEFIKYHKNRVNILKHIKNKFKDFKLVISECILGFESLSKIKYFETKSSKERFIKFLIDIGFEDYKAELVYKIYRNPLVHEGLLNPWFCIDEDYTTFYIDEKDIDENMAGMEIYPAEAFLSFYENGIYFLEDFLKKKKREEIQIPYWVYKDVIFEKEENKRMKEHRKKLKKFRNKN